MRKKSLLMWEGRFYTSLINTWVLSEENDGSIVLSVNKTPSLLGIYVYSIPSVVMTLVIIYGKIFEPTWFNLEIAQYLFLPALFMLIVICLLFKYEVSQLQKLPDTILRYSRNSECHLYDGSIVIPSDAEKIIHYIYDYHPSNYEEGFKDGNEGREFFEVNLEVISLGKSKLYGLASGDSEFICQPVAKKLSLLTNWPLKTQW